MTLARRDGIPEDRVALILARAAELDKADGTVGFDAIRNAAIEAGISSAAVDQALEEYMATARLPAVETAVVSEVPTPISRWDRWRQKLGRTVEFGVLGFALGLPPAIEIEFIVFSLLAYGLIAARLIWNARPSRKARGFQTATAALTFGMCLGLISATADGEVAATMVLVGVMVIAAGTLAIKMRLLKGLHALFSAEELEHNNV